MVLRPGDAGPRRRLRELEFELGEVIPRVVAQATYEFYRRRKEEHPQVFGDLSFLVLRGVGVPENLRPTRDELAEGIDVRNGYHGAILAGMVAAGCGLENPSWSWEEPSPGVVRIRIAWALFKEYFSVEDRDDISRRMPASPGQKD